MSDESPATGNVHPVHGEQSPVTSEVSGRAPSEVAKALLRDVKRGNAYADKKKGGFKKSASAVKVAALSLSAASTIILGLQHLEFWAGLAFAMVALSTVISAIEPFFNWRSRWILMEEMQYRFYRLEDDLSYYLAKTPPDNVKQEEVDHYFAQYQDLWHSVSLRWLEQRGLEKSAPRSVERRAEPEGMAKAERVPPGITD